MQYEIEKDGVVVGMLEADSEAEARKELAQEHVFGDADVVVREVKNG